jgi:acetoin utilization protein AcuB
VIVSEVMTTKLVTVTPSDRLGHAANLLRQHRFHHLPVVRCSPAPRALMASQQESSTPPVLEGILTAQNIDLALASDHNHASGPPQRPWEDVPVSEVMERPVLCVTPTTSVAAAAKLLVERGLDYLPVVEYSDAEGAGGHTGSEAPTYLVGLLTRSDLLLALARALGIFEPGSELLIPLPTGNLSPLANMLLLAAELHMPVQSLIVVPPKDAGPRMATVRLGTINPAPLFARLREGDIAYEFGHFQPEGDSHAW